MLKKIIILINFYSFNLLAETQSAKSYIDIVAKTIKEYTNYDIVKFSTIPFSSFKIVKSEVDDCSRTVFFDEKHNKYIKIWTKNYNQIPFFLDACKKGFYYLIAPLQSLIYDDNNFCLGYITYCDNFVSCRHNLLMENNIILNTDLQNKEFGKFIEILYKKMTDLKIIYYDLVPDNVFFDGTKYLIVDLEPVRDFENLKQLPNMNEILSYNPLDYASFVKSLLR